MPIYEYRVVPSPVRAGKGKGSVESRFADEFALVLNAEGREGWEFLRAETLPREERQGLTGSKRVFQTMLVFRRLLTDMADEADGDAMRLIEDKTDPTDVAEPGDRTNN